jgi:hypothetical protein
MTISMARTVSLDGRIDIGAVTIDEINVFHLEALEGVVDTFDDMFVRQTGIVGAFAAPKNLG